MDPRNVAQLESLGNELAADITALRRSPPRSTADHSFLNGPESERQNRESIVRILSSLSAIRALVCGPTDFLEHLAIQVIPRPKFMADMDLHQLKMPPVPSPRLSTWLGEFQILACIPPTRSVPIKDVAELSNVPLRQLTRIIRLTATAGFLSEPEHNHVAHTALSVSFVANPALHDAAMFLAQSVASAALQAAPATRRFGDSRVATETAYALGMNDNTTSFRAVQAQNPKLSRQWAAFMQYSAGIPADQDVIEALAQLNWSNVANARGKIVEIGGCKIAPLLARLYPKLHFVIQHTEPVAFDPAANRPNDHKPQITVTCRVPGTQQIRTGAAVYVLHPASSLSELHAELQVHLPLLRILSSSMIIVTTHVLPEAGRAEPSTNAGIARARDLVLHQMSNEEEMEMPALLDIIDTVRDAAGKMVVVHTLRSRISMIVALVVKYQLFTGTEL